MKLKMGVAVLAAACVVLAVVLIVINNQADVQQKKAAGAISDLSNQVVNANDEVIGLHQVNLMLTNDLAASRQDALTFSNNLLQTSGALTETKSMLQSAQDQITNLDVHVTDLQAQNQALDRRVADLTNSIASLNVQIADTQLKLVASETNNAFLEDQLKQQVDEKNELQRNFDSLQAVRAQVKKLRDDALTARRLEWMRQGIDPSTPLKGGQLLMRRTPKPARSAPNNELNVEVGSDGSVHIIPAPSNAHAATNSP
jgi:chromosome segregation ATPase